MFNLFTSYYTDKSPDRQKEIDQCLINNIACTAIDKIYVLTEEGVESELLESDKIVHLNYNKRPTYNTFFRAIRSFASESDWNVIANSDIYFDESLSLVDKYNSNSPICFALCRWEVLKSGELQFLNRPDSQDCWIIKGHPRNTVNGDFCLGVCGCDNAIAHRFDKCGYNVINPSRTIKTYHLHLSGVRNYNVNVKVPQPYKVIHPTV